MRAVIAREAGDASVLAIGSAPDPIPGPGEALIRVRGTSVNRADILQRRGLYPPPPGASDILGLEAVGEVVTSPPGAAVAPVLPANSTTGERRRRQRAADAEEVTVFGCSPVMVVCLAAG